MDYSTLVAGITASNGQAQPAAPSLYLVCQQLTDGCAARWRRYDLAALLVLLILAKLAGMQSLLGASDWIADQLERLCRSLPLSWKRMPCANTYKYVLARLDSRQVNSCIAAWLVRMEAQSRCGQEPSRLVWQANQRSVHLAIDGKALKGTGKQPHGGEEPQKQVLHIYEVGTGIVLQQCPIALEQNEVSTLKPWLTPDPVSRTHSDRRCCPELSRVWAADAAGGRRCDSGHQRQYARGPGRSGTVF